MLRVSWTIQANVAFVGNKECVGFSLLPKLGCLAALLMVVWTGSIPAATVTIDGSQTYQVIDGFGVNANHRSWTNNELQPVLDALIDQAGMTIFHVIFDNNNWEAVNDNSDPNVMNWTYYNSIYSAPDFQKLWGIMAYLNQRGITNGLVPDFEGPVALWMGGLSLTPGLENEYAETIASLLVYARNTQHLQFTVVGPVNEPDLTYTGIHLTDASQYVTVMHDLSQQLDNNGLSDVRFSGPDLATTSTAWLGTIMTDPVIMAKLAHFGLHSYLGQTPDATGVYDFIQQSAYPNSHFWMTEFNVWCQSCAYNGVGDNSWTFARGTATCLLNHLAKGASAGIVWEGYDSQLTQFNAATGGNNPPHWSCWGLFAVDDTNAVPKTYTPRKGFYTLAQIAKFVRPGAQRIDVSVSSTPLTVLAFYNTNNGQFTLTGANTNSSASSLSCALWSLPAIPSLDFYYTSSTTNLCHGGSVAVTNGAFAAMVPADCVFTLTTSIVPPLITTQPTNLLVLSGTNVAFGVSATSTVPPGYQWQFNGTNILNATSALYSIAPVNTNTAGIYSVVVTNAAGSAMSSNAALTVVLSPASQTNSVGATATFTTTAFSPVPLNYQWQKNGTNLVNGGNLSGAINRTLTIASVSDADAGSYRAVVSDTTGSVTTSNAVLTVSDLLFIAAQPQSQTVRAGNNVTFNVTVYGAPPFVFLWYFNGTPLGSPAVGGNLLSCTLSNVETNQAGSYSVEVINGYGSVMSSNALLTVIIPPRLELEIWAGYPLLNLYGMLNSNYVVQYNGNLGGTNWLDLLSLTNLPFSPYLFLDPAGIGEPARFYRVFMQY